MLFLKSPNNCHFQHYLLINLQQEDPHFIKLLLAQQAFIHFLHTQLAAPNIYLCRT